MTSPDRAEDRAERGPRTYAVHSRLTLSGTLGPAAMPVEAWSMNLSYARTAAPTQALVDEVWTKCVTWFSGTTSGINPLAQLRQVKIALVGTDGKTVGNPAVHVGIASGGTNDVHSPPQIALAVSLGTGLRGSTHRGRFYLPMPTVISTPDFTIQQNDHDAIETALGTWLDALQVSFGGAGSLVVASSKGFNTPVTGIRVGRVLDTIRTRRRSLKESYDTGRTIV